MLTFEWDALRQGDLVLVHDDEAGGRLLPGVVEMVDRGRSGRGSSDVGIRTVEADSTSRVRRPRRLATHLDPFDRDESCWRCKALASSAPARPRS